MLLGFLSICLVLGRHYFLHRKFLWLLGKFFFVEAPGGYAVGFHVIFELHIAWRVFEKGQIPSSRQREVYGRMALLKYQSGSGVGH